MVCVLILILQVSLLCAAQMLRAVPEKAELGTFNTFQIKETTIKLRNTGRKAFLIDKIKADCACIRTSIDTKEILPGEMIDLKMAAGDRSGGKFSHDILIIPKDTEHYEPLKIQVTGNIVEPVFAEVGWLGRKIERFDPNGPVKLGLVHKLSAKPVIYITADDKYFNLRESVPDVNSFFFELESHRFEKIPATNPMQLKEQGKERLVLFLKPKKTLKIGTFKENVRIKLADDVGLGIPITSRIVGDIYEEETIIHLGNLCDSAPDKCIIHFIDDSKTWKDIKWEAQGYLSGAIAVRKEDSICSSSQIGLIVDADKSKLESIPKGYVFCHIKFFQNQPTDDEVVNILIDGFNTKPEI